MLKVTLNPGKEHSAQRFHPWIFSGAIKKITNNSNELQKPKEGDLVKVVSNKDEFLGIGHYQNGSIMVRLITFEEQEINLKFWVSKIQEAYNLRALIELTSNSKTNIYRLIHAEGDGLPGLIIDYYNGTLVIQSHSIGMHYAKNDLVKALKMVYQNNLKF